MAYRSMVKLITNENKLLDAGQVTEEEYALFKQNSMNKLDVFLAANRITSAQYTELSGMLR
jgi:hypothetical protein